MTDSINQMQRLISPGAFFLVCLFWRTAQTVSLESCPEHPSCLQLGSVRMWKWGSNGLGAKSLWLGLIGWSNPSHPATHSLILGGNFWGLYPLTNLWSLWVPEWSVMNEMTLKRKESSVLQWGSTEMNIMGKPAPGPLENGNTIWMEWPFSNKMLNF